VMTLSSHASDGAVESCRPWHYRGNWAVMRCRCRVILAMALPRQLGCGEMSMLSHAVNGIAESC
jgi:hypothetical protein